MIFLAVRRRPIRKKHKKLLISVILITVLVILFIEIRLRPVTHSVAERQSCVIATEAIDNAVIDVLDEMNLECDDLEKIIQDEDGTISAVHTNTLTVNKLKSKINQSIQDTIGHLENCYIEIPIGTILGSELLGGRGPRIPLYLSNAGSIKADFESTFESGGVNQTLHKLNIVITAEITVILPMSSFTSTVTTTVLVGETLIVGTVPAGGYLYRTST